MSRSASKVREPRTSLRRDVFFKNRRSESAECGTRGSYAPEKIRPASDERKSGNSGFNRWSGARKSSINIGDVKRKDVRPLTDKAYQKRKISELVAFLEEQDFKYPLNRLKLLSPSKKDFEIIFQFLYSSFDLKYEVKKIEEEAPRLLKNLAYPFIVNKSAFACVARTNFPSLLGILIWLMDLNKFVMNVNINSLFESDYGDEKNKANMIVLRYIYQCYHSRTDNPETDDEAFSEIVKSLMPFDLDELLEQNNEKMDQLKAVEKELEEIKSLSDEKDQFNKSIENYEKYFVEMKAHIEKRKDLRDEMLNQLKLEESQLRALQDKIAIKQEAYDAQGFDGKKQLSYFESQKKCLIEKLEKKKAAVKDLQDKLWDAEMQFSQNLDKVNDASDAFSDLHRKALEESKAAFSPIQSIKNPQIQKLHDAQLDFPLWEISPSTSNSDCKATQQNALESMLSTIKNTSEVLKRIAVSQSDKLSQVQIKKSELSMQIKLLSVQESHKENDINSKEKQAVDEIALLESQCDKVKKSVDALQTERQKYENMRKEMINEFTVLEAFGQKKTNELNEYLTEQSEIFAYMLESEKIVSEKALEYGNEIFQKIEHDLLEK